MKDFSCHQQQFKGYLVAYFISQIKCLVMSEVVSYHGFESEPFKTKADDVEKTTEPKISRDYIKNKNEAWLQDRDQHVENSRRHIQEQKERRRKYLMEEVALMPSRPFDRDSITRASANRTTYSSAPIGDVHDYEQHYNLNTSVLLRCETHWSGEYHVGDHVRNGHIRNTKDGPVWVSSHGVRGHKKRKQ